MQVTWLIQLWLENGGSVKDLLMSDSGFKPCNKPTYMATLKKWLFKCRSAFEECVETPDLNRH